MSTYIILSNYTEQGIRDVKDSPARLDAVKKLLGDLGGRLTAFYLTMGSYDIVVIIDLPSDQAAARFALTIGALGNVRTTTLKAFTESEFKDIVQSLP